VHVVIEVHSTDEARVDPPKRNEVAVAPTPNPVPVIVTGVPPAVDPVLGLTLVTVGSAKVNSSRLGQGAFSGTRK
jgi:hypothetical protein